jgi:hypothetical protein
MTVPHNEALPRVHPQPRELRHRDPGHRDLLV